jgi:hypothetical protein
LLDKDDREYTTWHVAAFTGNSEVFEEPSEWATEKLNSDELNNLLLAKEDCLALGIIVGQHTDIRETMELG